MDPRITPGQEVAASVFSHVVALAITSPLEVVRAIQQIGTAEGGDFLSTFRNIWNSEGILGFYKGLPVRCAAVYPQLLLHSSLKRWLSPRVSQVPGLASSLAEVSAIVVTYPWRVLNTRYVQQLSSSPVYPMFFALGMPKIIAEEGLGALIRGLVPTSVGIFISQMISSFVSQRTQSWQPQSQTAWYSLPQSFLVRMLSLVASRLVSYPLSVIGSKERAQSKLLRGAIRCDITCTGPVDCANQIFAREGFTGFYAGFIATILDQVPYEWCRIVFQDLGRKVFRFWNGFTESPFSDTPKKHLPQNLTPKQLRRFIKDQQPNPPNQ